MAKHMLVSLIYHVFVFQVVHASFLPTLFLPYYRKALSRATELKLLTLKGFSEKSFRAHPKVKVGISMVFVLNQIFT